MLAVEELIRLTRQGIWLSANDDQAACDGIACKELSARSRLDQFQLKSIETHPSPVCVDDVKNWRKAYGRTFIFTHGHFLIITKVIKRTVIDCSVLNMTRFLDGC